MPMLRSSLMPQRALGGRAALIAVSLAALVGPAALWAADSKAPARPQLTAAQIVDKHVAARGGLQGWRSLQTLSLSGKMEAGTGDSIERSIKVSHSRKAPSIKQAAVNTSAADKAGPQKQVELPFLMQMKRPGKSRVEIEFAGSTAVQVYDGTHGWKVRPYLNRKDVEAFTTEEAKAETEKGDLEGPLVGYAAKGTKVDLETIEPVQGHDAYKLKLTLKTGKVQHIWIDTQSFLDVKIDGLPRRMDGKMHDVWIYQSDFRKVDGLMVPFMLETAVDGFPGSHKMLIEKVEVNPKLDDARFAKPKA